MPLLLALLSCGASAPEQIGTPGPKYGPDCLDEFAPASVDCGVVHFGWSEALGTLTAVDAWVIGGDRGEVAVRICEESLTQGDLVAWAGARPSETGAEYVELDLSAYEGATVLINAEGSDRTIVSRAWGIVVCGGEVEHDL